uniref:Uncharacterized protein n=1 Tax=Hyaloperonospora arabidopsidis (strain Emoy2) TaxID=559515 RepID=M4BYF6_HYAAE
MKARLDSVHQQVDLPTLNASHYDSGKCTAEEGPILEELDVDVYASGSWDTGRRDTSRTFMGYSELQIWTRYHFLTGAFHNGYAN